MKRSISKTSTVLALVALGACASIVATQTFEISTEIAMPSIPRIPTSEPQTVRLTARFGSCSRTALGSLDKLRENSHVDAADVWVVVRDVHLESNSSFEGIEQLQLQLVTPEETVTICDRRLSDADQRGSTVDCEFEHRVRAEQLCMMLGGSTTGVAQMSIELEVSTGDITLTTLGATLNVDTVLEADVSL